MIKQTKTTKDGWVYETFTFPEGYNPKSVKWRHRDGEYQVFISRKVESETEFKNMDIIDRKVAPRYGKLTLTGWVDQPEKNYQFDVEDASENS